MATERATHLAEEDDSYFISMTDLMVGMLFIFIIMLMAFALSFREAQQRQMTINERLREDQQKQMTINESLREAQQEQKTINEGLHEAQQKQKTINESLREAQQEQKTINEASLGSRKARDVILDSLKDRLDKRGVEVIIDKENGVLRLKADVLFEKGSSNLTASGAEIIGHVALALEEVVPCYAKSRTELNLECPTIVVTPLEAIFIEGHTDPDPFDPRSRRDNWILSAERAISTFKQITSESPLLNELRNGNDQHLLGVAGYEARRQIAQQPGQSRDEWYAALRRIDIRFIMKSLTPEIIKFIESSLEKN